MLWFLNSVTNPIVAIFSVHLAKQKHQAEFSDNLWAWIITSEQNRWNKVCGKSFFDGQKVKHFDHLGTTNTILLYVRNHERYMDGFGVELFKTVKVGDANV